VHCSTAFVALYSFSISAQKQKAKRTKKVAAKTSGPPSASAATDPATNEKRVKDLITFLEFVLNTLGSGTPQHADKRRADQRKLF